MRAIKLPTNGMPPAWVLKMITFPPPKEYFLPRVDAFGRKIAPVITIPEQQEIRKACLMAGLDPVKVVGLPAEKQEEQVVKTPKKLTDFEQTAIERVERQRIVEENMASMDERVKEYRQARKEKRKKQKAELPF